MRIAVSCLKAFFSLWKVATSCASPLNDEKIHFPRDRWPISNTLRTWFSRLENRKFSLFE